MRPIRPSPPSATTPRGCRARHRLRAQTQTAPPPTRPHWAAAGLRGHTDETHACFLSSERLLLSVCLVACGCMCVWAQTGMVRKDEQECVDAKMSLGVLWGCECVQDTNQQFEQEMREYLRPFPTLLCTR